MPTADAIVIGAGIFGVSTAIHLSEAGYKVVLIEQGAIPHPLSASDDISKAVRVEYGSDELYFNMARESIEGWKKWNVILGVDVYHEVGYTMFSKRNISSEVQSYEQASLHLLRKHGYSFESFYGEEISARFPCIREGAFAEAVYNPAGGYVESGTAIKLLVGHYKHEIKYMTQCKVDKVIKDGGKAIGVQLASGELIYAGVTVVAAGVYSAELLPELTDFFKVTGHPLFWLSPGSSKMYQAPALSVYSADISNSGWYGFPHHLSADVVKIGLHAQGTLQDPHNEQRLVTEEELTLLDEFLKSTFSELSISDLVLSKKCLYTDTYDGDYLLSMHPELENCAIATGGSGHGMKMGPMIGAVMKDVIAGISNQYTERFRWRDPSIMQGHEEARFQ